MIEHVRCYILDRDIELVYYTIRKSSDVLTRDPMQLGAQVRWYFPYFSFLFPPFIMFTFFYTRFEAKEKKRGIKYLQKKEKKCKLKITLQFPLFNTCYWSTMLRYNIRPFLRINCNSFFINNSKKRISLYVMCFMWKWCSTWKIYIHVKKYDYFAAIQTTNKV